jgi:hypothetical protein
MHSRPSLAAEQVAELKGRQAEFVVLRTGVSTALLQIMQSLVLYTFILILWLSVPGPFMAFGTYANNYVCAYQETFIHY